MLHDLKITYAAALLLSALSGVCAAQAQDVLRPEEAFPYTLSASASEVSVQFQVPDGYYLYRHRFGFSSETPGVALAEPDYPQGKIYEDEFFGVVETYRGEFQIDIPYQRSASAQEMDLDMTLQGCADIGLCYPPQRWSRSVALPRPEGRDAGGLVADVLSGGRPNEVLPPDEAFRMDSRVDGANQLTVSWQIEPGYYLYRDKFSFSSDSPIQLAAPRLPPGEPHYDEHFGDVEVFYDYVEAQLAFSRATPNAIDVAIDTVFQGCKIDSICYPLIERTTSLALPASSAFAAPVGGGIPAPVVSEQDRLAALVLSDSWWLVLGTFYGLGLLLAFTPCVLPMVPILSGIIAGQGEQVTAARGFALSFAYVMGMAVTYTVGGALAAMAGEQVQAAFQQPWIITLFAGLFVVLALAMFGAFELQMPAAVQTRMANLANQQRAGTFVGTAIMGALSALIVTTCVAPPLVATLAVIGQAGDVTRGAGALFALSLGMGSPLLLVGASAGKLLPKAGPWMNAVKAAFGVMMLGLAIWMMERVLPGSITLVLWALLVFLSGVFLGAFEPLPETPSPTRRLSKGLGVLACLYGAFMLLGATLGGEDPLQPIPRGALLAPTGQRDTGGLLAFQGIESVADLQTALAKAQAAGAPVMIDFTADWCVACKEYEEYTFPDEDVIAALEPFVLLQADVTDNDDDDKALLQYFSSYGPPTIAFYDRSGRPREGFKLVGFVPADEFTAHVRRVAAL
jgi:thiol:disulfide interchange protein DsbD